MKSPQQQAPGNPTTFQHRPTQGRLAHPEKLTAPLAPRPAQSASTQETGRGEPRGWGRRLPPLLNDNHNARIHELPSSRETDETHYTDTVYAGHQAHAGMDPSRELGNGQHYDRRYSYGQNVAPSGRNAEFMVPRLEYTDMRVFSTPYGYTANNQPLFIQYGTPSGDVAAQAVLALGHGYYTPGQYGVEMGDGQYQYGNGLRHGMEDYRYGLQRGVDWRNCQGGQVGNGHGMDAGREGGQTGGGAQVEENRGDGGSQGRRMEGMGVERGENGGADGRGVLTEGGGNEKKTDMRCGGAVEEMAAACTLEELREMREAERCGDGQKNVGENGVAVQLMQKASGRITWTAELHTEFLKALDELGLEQAVPMSILNKMGVSGLTREQVASHLQKHRTMLRKEKEVKERTMLLNMAARSVLKRDENLGKRSLTAEEVMDAVAREERLNGAGDEKEEEEEEEEKKKGGFKGLCKLSRGKRNGTKVKEVIGKGRRLSRRGLHSIPKHAVRE